MKEIELASVQDLIDELSKRFDSSIFYGVKKKTGAKEDGETEEDDVYWWNYIGCRVACLGLCKIMEEKLKESIKDSISIDKEDF
ncbi:MAG: hypothetical protein FJW63_01835 [Actinobacteria bacterium]|nr:hypothetical protein [Actinomycetota bacterium]